MNASDANKLLSVAKANYSYAFKGMSEQEKVLLVQSWAFALQDIPSDVVLMAFMQLLSVSKWLPTVAEIRQTVMKLRSDAETILTQNRQLARLGYGKANARESAMCEYIVNSTEQSRFEFGREAELSLESMLAGGCYVGLGDGRMDTESIGRPLDTFGADREDI